MKLVIDIPGEIRKAIFDGVYCGVVDIRVYDAIKNGIPLPKGHGRLIDADEVDDAIYKCFEGIQCYDGTGYDIYSDSKEGIDKIPPIIEADKIESEDMEKEE